MSTENDKLLIDFVGNENLPYYLFKSELKFSSDWNLLMKVVEKIDQTRTVSSTEGSYLYCVSLNGSYANIMDGKNGEIIIEIRAEDDYTWIGTTYKLAVEFVKWYNNQKK